MKRSYKPKGYRTRRRGYNRKALQSRVANRRYRYRISSYGLKRYRFNRVHRPLGGFPTRRTTTLRYVENFTLNPGSETIATYVFRANSIFDPNYAFGGHQPMYMDNYSALYSKYKVNYATCTFIALDTHVVNTTTPNLVDGTNVGDNFFYNGNERAVRQFILVDNSPTDYPTKLNTLIEEGNPKLRWKFAPQTTSGRMHKVTKKAWPHKIQNLSYNDDSLSALTSANPSNQIFFICGVDSLGGANADEMNYQVIITYNVTFFDFIGGQSEN